MKLTSDRLEAEKGERFRAVLIVHPSVVAVIAAGGMDHLRHELEDVGFAVHGLFAPRPAGEEWLPGASVPTPGDLEWLVYGELEATEGGSFSRAFTEDLRVAQVWRAEHPATRVATVPHPYAVDAEHGTGMLAGRWLAFGVAYPLTRGEGGT